MALEDAAALAFLTEFPLLKNAQLSPVLLALLRVCNAKVEALLVQGPVRPNF